MSKLYEEKRGDHLIRVVLVDYFSLLLLDIQSVYIKALSVIYVFYFFTEMPLYSWKIKIRLIFKTQFELLCLWKFQYIMKLFLMRYPALQ